ncbi:hypothetical protein GQ44DRAFT_700031 [Phaeosphaeriaceae sp. PMI808]|nr:hypothetical protein GQ44DRAFT_700031 [Phaeosphaeriaceae sp. PMI808]
MLHQKQMHREHMLLTVRTILLSSITHPLLLFCLLHQLIVRLGTYGNPTPQPPPPPPPASYASYGSYPPPAGGYATYGTYKKE